MDKTEVKQKIIDEIFREFIATAEWELSDDILNFIVGKMDEYAQQVSRETAKEAYKKGFRCSRKTFSTNELYEFDEWYTSHQNNSNG